MSYIITAIISIIFGAGLALLVRNSGNAAAEEQAFQDGYEEGRRVGHHEGYRRGKVSPEQKIISNALVDEIVYGGPRRGGIMCELDGMRFKSAKIVSKDEAPMVLSCDRVDKAPGFDSIRPE